MGMNYVNEIYIYIRVYVGIVRQLVLWDIHINKDGSFWFGGHCIIPN